MHSLDPGNTENAITGKRVIRTRYFKVTEDAISPQVRFEDRLTADKHRLSTSAAIDSRYGYLIISKHLPNLVQQRIDSPPRRGEGIFLNSRFVIVKFPRLYLSWVEIFTTVIPLLFGNGEGREMHRHKRICATCSKEFHSLHDMCVYTPCAPHFSSSSPLPHRLYLAPLSTLHRGILQFRSVPRIVSLLPSAFLFPYNVSATNHTLQSLPPFLVPLIVRFDEG